MQSSGGFKIAMCVPISKGRKWPRLMPVSAWLSGKLIPGNGALHLVVN